MPRAAWLVAALALLAPAAHAKKPPKAQAPAPAEAKPAGPLKLACLVSAPLSPGADVGRALCDALHEAGFGVAATQAEAEVVLLGNLLVRPKEGAEPPTGRASVRATSRSTGEIVASATAQAQAAEPAAVQAELVRALAADLAKQLRERSPR